MLQGRNILLCVSGGIAVYKAAALTSKLTQAGANVKIIMSESAMKFVAPLTFQALSRNDVYYNTFDEKDVSVIAHIDLADWADLVIVAPATANTISKLAYGIADNMMTTTILATSAPIWIAPAMNVHMYDHPAVQKNIDILVGYGYKFIEPSEGHLACGYVGKGRLEEPEKIVELVSQQFTSLNTFSGKNFLITAGPTRERIDPVRFLSNRSTGKMGYAIAEEAAKAGANVTLISGPTALKPPKNVNIINVESAAQMLDEVLNNYHQSDVVIKSAAVADYRPKNTYVEKLKKADSNFMLELERTVDILKLLGERKKHQLLVGFAAETESLEQNARRKLETKKLDMIIANNIKQEGAGFGADTNIITIYKRNGNNSHYPILSKNEVAKVILNEVATLLKEEIK